MNKYYWIKVDGIVHKHIPIFKNVDGKWVYKSQSTTSFISDYVLELLHGKGCILREVDFENDVVNWEINELSDIQTLEYFYVEADSGNPMVMFGTQNLFYYHTANSWAVNKFNPEKKLCFKEVI